MEGRGGGRDAVGWVMDGCVLATRLHVDRLVLKYNSNCHAINTQLLLLDHNLTSTVKHNGSSDAQSSKMSPPLHLHFQSRHSNHQC
jgi:hypothetical protein